MAKGVDKAFEEIIERLKPAGTETVTAASHRQSIESCLKNNFGMTRMFRSGSFGHGTSVRWHSDVDYFAVIPASNLWDNSTYTLQKVKEALDIRFPRTPVSVRTPAIAIPFGPGGDEYHEIIPVYLNGTSGGHQIYSMPNRYGGWMNSSPPAHNAWVNAINDKLYKKVKSLIRLVKYWNYINNVGLRSFYVELRTAEYANNEKAIVYSLDVRDTFRTLIQKNIAAMQDPQGIGGYIHPCTDAQKVSALSKLNTAYTRACKAVEAEQDGKHAEAFEWWDKVFNGYFPAYY